MLKMEGFIGGPITINSIGADAIVNFGGSLYLSPKNISKTSAGSGAAHTYVIGINRTGPSVTNSVDVDVIDQAVSLDN